MKKRDIDAMMFAIDLIKEFKNVDQAPEHQVRCNMAIESMHNVINREVGSLPQYSRDWSRINIGPYTIFQPVDGSFYLCHVDGEGGAFSSNRLLETIHRLFEEDF